MVHTKITGSIRQSVTVPDDLARKIQRNAKRKHQTFSKALVDYARLGVAEEEKAKQKLGLVVRKIQAASSDEEAESLALELTEAIFGPQSPSRA